jgi:FAD/FMN-containing dehydrogenase
LQTNSSISLIDGLRDGLNGQVITPDDPDYDRARMVFPGGIDRRPAVIVRPVDVAGVARVIGCARQSGLPFAIRSGGHSGAGHGTTDGGIVLDLRSMATVEVDAVQRTAWAGAGMTAGEYSKEVGAHGLATGFGDTGSVGIGGITLGGGVGYLSRKFGLTIDSLLAAEIVTAAGDCLRVDASSHPDLFWAIRGGGGNFGVVTRFQYQLHSVDRVVGGMLLLPATADVIVRLIAAAEAAPEELSIIANVMPAPPMPFVPEAQRGRLSVMLLLCYAGDEDAGIAAVAPFRALAQPVVDMVRPLHYPELFPPEDPSYRPSAVGRTMFMRTVDRGSAETMIDYLEKSDASVRVAQLRVLGGAIARIPSDATAYAHRSSRIMVNVAAFYNGPADKPVREDWVTKFAAALDQGDSAAYVNFLADEGEARVRAAYPGATWDRLAAVKARYDPANLFRLNQNVPPAA